MTIFIGEATAYDAIDDRVEVLEAGAVDGAVTPLGFESATVTTVAGLPDIPEGADLAFITVTGGDVRWRDDGTDPTTTVGQPMTAPDRLTYEGDLDAIKWVAQTGTPATLDVSYYSRAASGSHIYRLVEGVDYQFEAGATPAASGFALIYDGIGVGLFGSLETVPVGGELQLITFLNAGWDVGWDAIVPGSIYATVGEITAYGPGPTLKPSVTVWPENVGLKMYIESGANENTILWFTGQRWVPVDPPVS